MSIVVGLGVFQAMAPSLFETPPGGGWNMQQTLWAGVVGGGCGVIGALIGKLIDRRPK